MTSSIDFRDWNHEIPYDERLRHIIAQVKAQHIDIAHDRNTWLGIGMDLYNRYGDAGEEYFLAISDAYSDPQKDDPVKVYRSFAGKPYSTSPGVLINAAK